MNHLSGERVLTELDHVRLAGLAARAPKPSRSGWLAVDAVLDEASVVPSRGVAPDVVTMESKVRLRFPGDGVHRTITVCYPGDADARLGRVSVLSPIGLALLGQRVGSTVRWVSPDGNERIAEVDAIVFQPEASGDYTT